MEMETAMEMEKKSVAKSHEPRYVNLFIPPKNQIEFWDDVSETANAKELNTLNAMQDGPKKQALQEERTLTASLNWFKKSSEQKLSKEEEEAREALRHRVFIEQDINWGIILGVIQHGEIRPGTAQDYRDFLAKQQRAFVASIRTLPPGSKRHQQCVVSLCRTICKDPLAAAATQPIRKSFCSIQ